MDDPQVLPRQVCDPLPSLGSFPLPLVIESSAIVPVKNKLLGSSLRVFLKEKKKQIVRSKVCE